MKRTIMIPQPRGVFSMELLDPGPPWVRRLEQCARVEISNLSSLNKQFQGWYPCCDGRMREPRYNKIDLLSISDTSHTNRYPVNTLYLSCYNLANLSYDEQRRNRREMMTISWGSYSLNNFFKVPSLNAAWTLSLPGRSRCHQHTKA